ncbi:cytosolic sulfotransferase 12-like isoform X2 [Brassica rapa]|uniref:cytosolic sulfotransferase 12-like isoform X2 n=1 Tax=Brassica campestris TaxID=3711 RepID=UPI00142E7E4F|nr:cytosolic sulfotransferase 12-like isoform X2 [Brassica rapa]
MTSSSVPIYLGDEDLTQETRDLLSSLPSEKGWLVSQIYQFEGSWHTQGLVQGILNCQKNFKAKDSDIILATTPKSDYRVSPDVDFSELPSPRLMQTHLQHHSLPASIKSSSCKIVYCCRDPKDVFVSLWHFGRKLSPEETAEYPIEKVVEAFCQGKFIGGPFWDHVLEYWYESRKNPNKVLFVTYEELKKQTEVEVKRIADFIGCGFTAEEEVSEIVKLCSFESLSKLEVNRQGKLPNGIESNSYFRKGEIGGWRDTLSESLAEVIDRTTEEKFRGSGLKFSC